MGQVPPATRALRPANGYKTAPEQSQTEQPGRVSFRAVRRVMLWEPHEAMATLYSLSRRGDTVLTRPIDSEKAGKGRQVIGHFRCAPLPSNDPRLIPATERLLPEHPQSLSL